ncbi:hypothetical protein BU24DRAFT_114148 [Aaosphaeria arxii CBS 175.79]|uniref:Uncharacterized protein n=1 Tax=Aaosphaeria arxii CBS 175.79 TaxID=1450172 RepID=A0A6A5Y1R1_9PLEO|nr:uncharacterized protein BU24DRAFT_114148 [Aaosphaeria arxii CBS 175.79]KAF2019143.1 hypothetical protein BU24DRAFT_114148 [Aaosphaeria arxii CBS 175.79]
MAKRALRKASEAPKGTTTNTGNTPKKRKRASASTSTSMTTEGAISKKLQRKSTGLSDDGAIPPGSTRKRSARASAIHYAEDNDEDEEDRSFEDEEEAEAEGGAQEVRHWREPSVASDNLTPAAHATHWKRQARHSDPTQDRSRSGSASKPSRVVKLPVDKKKLTVFQAWDGWREYDGHAQTNSPPVGAHVLPPNPYAQSSNPPPTGHAVDIPKQYIDKSAGERSGSRPAEGAPYQQREMAAEPVRQDFINPTPTGFQAINRRPVDPSPQVEHRVQLPPPPPPPVESQPLVSRSNTEQTSPNLPTQPHPTHAASRPSSSSTGHPGGEENLLKRRQIFSTLIDLLKSPVPSNVVSVSLEPLIESIWTEAEDDYMMQVFSEDDLPRVTKAFTSWISLHETLESFRQRTRYYGRSGDEWQRFRRSLGFLERVPMMEAMNELGQMRLRQIDAGDWFDETTFDRDLAAFLGALTRIPGVGAEDLEDGFAGYNKELLAWFY